MKIDSIINEVSKTTSNLTIITNNETIDSFFNYEKYHKDGYGLFIRDQSEKVRSICRSGVTISFINQSDLKEITFH